MTTAVRERAATVAPTTTGAAYQLTAEQTAAQLDVEIERGLSSAEAASRLSKYGANRLEEKKKEPGWKAFARQYQDLIQIVLVGAAIINEIATGETGTSIVLFGLTVLNAVLGLRQEAKAEAALASLQQMLKTIARVRRDGVATEINAEELVPGDIVLIEAGNVAPADGRLIVAATLEIEEAALTGESVPVLKDTAPVDKPDVPLGDRLCMTYMNTPVTRGRGEFIVTGTGMNTEIGKIAGMLNKTAVQQTPLQKKLDELTKVFVALGGIAIVAVIGLGLLNDKSLETLFITGVALAVACIPTGLPVVVTTLLSLGTRELADQHAIVKRLPAVETLGSTSAICSDKTGTLTLNKMTARQLAIPGPGNVYKITGEGYSTQGDIMHPGGKALDLDPFLLPMALCCDASLDGEALIGDPTEGALIVLAAKGGVDIEASRHTYPRVAEIPFDSAYKFMGTFHKMVAENGQQVIRLFVKGAPDVIIDRSSAYWHPEQHSIPLNEDSKHRAIDANDQMARSGERVMVVARRDFDPAKFQPDGDLLPLVQDLTLLAMVGIVDPPRAEAKASIAECAGAGIRVRMITGDHATTAAAIGSELGIKGRAITGAEFAAMSDEELATGLDEIGVIARVAPEDKVRLVHLLQQNHEVVAMTGDGVNDAPALKAADIGVAMGITGTEVSKGAAVMILTDDNFSTIVTAVEHGRKLYDNLLKYVRFQMATLVAFLATFIGAGIFSIAGGIPLTPVEILWLNFAIDAPIAIALGFDRPTEGLMKRKPRPVEAPILSRLQWVRLSFLGLLMAAGGLLVYDWADGEFNDELVASTMLLTTLSIFHIFAGLSARDEAGTIFSRDSFPVGSQLQLYGLVVVLIILGTELSILQRILGTTSLTGNQWLVCLGVGLTLLIVEEAIKFVIRARHHPKETPGQSAPLAPQSAGGRPA